MQGSTQGSCASGSLSPATVPALNRVVAQHVLAQLGQVSVLLWDAHTQVMVEPHSLS